MSVSPWNAFTFLPNLPYRISAGSLPDFRAIGSAPACPECGILARASRKPWPAPAEGTRRTTPGYTGEMLIRTLTVLLGTCLLALAQQGPNVNAQKEAMKKLEFLTGKWSGEGWAMRGPGQTVKYKQAEDVQYKLDGLVLLIEGTGKDPETEAVTFRALATIAFDEASNSYRMRSFNAGRYLDTELRIRERGFEWGFEAGLAKILYVMKLEDDGTWVETGTVSMNGGPPRQILEMKLKKQ